MEPFDADEASAKPEAKMTPEQIEALARIIANRLPGLLRLRPYKNGGRSSYKPHNAGRSGAGVCPAQGWGVRRGRCFSVAALNRIAKLGDLQDLN
jgi:hypothetical protein